MFIENAAIETIRVGEALGPSALSNADYPVLFRVKDSALREGREQRKMMPCSQVKPYSEDSFE